MRFGSIMCPETSKDGSDRDEIPQEKKRKSITNVYSYMKTGLKQRKHQITKRLRKISVDRESIYNKWMVTQKSLKKEDRILEEDEEYIESGKYINEVKQQDENPSSSIDKFMLDNNPDTRLSEYENKTVSDESNSSTLRAAGVNFRKLQRNQGVKKKYNSGSVFNNNKFSLAVRYDSEKKDKKELKEFMKDLRNQIITQEEFSDLIDFKKFETNIENFSEANKIVEQLRYNMLESIKESLNNIAFQLDSK